MALKDSRINAVAFRISFDLYTRDEWNPLLVSSIDSTDAECFGSSVRGVPYYVLRNRVVMVTLVCTQTNQLQDLEKLIFGIPDDQKFNTLFQYESPKFRSCKNAIIHILS